MRVKLKRLAVLATCAVLSGGVLAACGDDDEGEDSAATSESTEAADATSVDLVATEYDFELSATPTAQTEEVTFDNQGEEFHVMIFARINEGFTTEEAIELEGEKGSADVVAQTEAGPGESKTVKVKGPIEPGEYAMLCPIKSKEGFHYELGQLEEFPIEG